MSRSKSIKGQKLPAKKLQQILLRSLSDQPKKRLNAKQLVKKLKIANSRISVDEALTTLLRDGKIRHVKDGKYRALAGDSSMSEPAEAYEGYVDLTRSGAAFIICEKLEQDVYVPAKRTMQAMQGDKVIVELGRRYGKRLEGTIKQILEHTTNRFVGRYQWSRNFSFVVPDSELIPFDIFVHPDDQGGAKEGDTVMVEVTSWPDDHRKSPGGKVIRIFDPEDRHEIKMNSILSDHGFSMDFPEHVNKEAEDLPKKITEQEISRRRDVRPVPTFTIDPKTAKDFDDAISCRTLDNGLTEVGVHIADVTHYVKPGSAMDQEAYKRSTSVYLVDRTAPMLPEMLSNELCSLRPDEDSLTFSAIFQFDNKGKVKDRWFGKTIIHSDRRFAYEEAQEVLDKKEGDHLEDLQKVAKIARMLRADRMKKGGITFETPEFQFELDEDNKPIAIHLKHRQETNLLIEDLMLLANQEVALFIAKKAKPPVPFVYRIHDLPDQTKLAEYSLFLKELGFTFDHQSPDQIRASFAKLNAAALEDENLAFAERSAVRTMAKAVYSTENIGHFGLGFDHYTHFTSPIRRYSDVMVHRILELNLAADFRAKKDDLDVRCVHISNQERKAAESERASIKFKQIEFISQYIGQTFEGYISGFIDSGIFVALRESGVEGMVSFDKLSEVYDIPENRLKAVARKSGKIYRIGDRIQVEVVEARLERAEVDFDLVE